MAFVFRENVKRKKVGGTDLGLKEVDISLLSAQVLG
jgi:hypothetical protein